MTRLGLDFVLDSLIQKHITDWEKQNIPRIFHKTTVERITGIYKRIYMSLQMIKNNKGAINMSFNIKDKILSVFVSFINPNDIRSILGTLLIFKSSEKLNNVISSLVLYTGIVATTWIAFSVLRNFESVCVEAFQVKIKALTEDEIKKSFQKKYGNHIEEFAHAFLKGELEEEILNLEKNIKDIRGNFELLRNEKDTLQRLKDVFAKVEEPLLCLETSKDGMI